MIESITETVKIGAIYTGKVVRIEPFGAFVEILPGQDGLVHISQLASERIDKVEDVARRVRALIDRDTAAYNEVVAAYRLPKANEAEKGARKEAIQRAMRSAIEAPLAVMRACRAALAQAAFVESHGNPNAASDVKVAQELLNAGLNGARANVEINLPALNDAEYVARVRREL